MTTEPRDRSSPQGQPFLVPQQGSTTSKMTFGHWSFSERGYRKLPEKDDALDIGQRRSSVLLPQLQISEKRFFELVALNDVDSVAEFLENYPNFNINCVNFQGVSALHLALQTSIGMVELLLQQPNIDIGDCVLHSIRDNQIKIMLLLLDKLQETAPGLEFVGATHSSDFADHVTPLILAAQCGHFEIIELLIERGHTINKPHPPNCRCSECVMHLQHDDLLHGETLRLNVYRAITNPAYICHSTNDPILTAFELSNEIIDCSRMVPEFRISYEDLAQEISAFAVELIACCRSTEEMDLILRQKNGISFSGQLLYPRLLLAMNCGQKAFVAHPNTQQMVEAAWHGDWYEWKYKHPFIRYGYPIYRLLMLPFMALICIFLPRHSWVKHWNIPLNKMISHNVGYTVFLIIIFLESNMDKTGLKRGPPNSGLELFIIIYVIGYIWGAFRLCMIQGLGRHFKSLWNLFDVITFALFVLTFVFWLASYLDVRQNDQADLERKYWHHLDPVLLAEGCFAIAVIMSYFRLLLLCRLNYYLGPLQISLGKMCGDIGRYFIIFTIIILAFSIGMCRFYQYYDGMVQVDDKGMKTAQVSSFVNFSAALKTFFWALFCMAAMESADVIIENLPGEHEKTTIINKHEFTEAVGYIVFALFEVLCVIMILNMLIATISNTFQRVTDNVDIEWTFGKTKLYIEYMLQTTLPPPLNLIPTARGMLSGIEWIQVATKNPPGKTARCTVDHCCYIETELDEHLARDFPILMSQLVQRYFREKDSDVDTGGDEMELVKAELAEIKFILRGGVRAPSTDVRTSKERESILSDGRIVSAMSGGRQSLAPPTEGRLTVQGIDGRPSTVTGERLTNTVPVRPSATAPPPGRGTAEPPAEGTPSIIISPPSP